jgi:hypothetical protein
MTTLREAALMALKALEFGHLPVADQAKHRDVMSYIEAMDVLRKALDADGMASLPDPVAWMDREGDIYRMPEIKNWAPPHTLLYPAPPQRKWQGLTDEEIEDEWERITGHSIFGGNKADGRAMYLAPDEVTEFTRAIEAKLKEKNT